MANNRNIDLKYKIGVIIGLVIIAVSSFTNDAKNILANGGIAGLGIILSSLALTVNAHSKKR